MRWSDSCGNDAASQAQDEDTMGSISATRVSMPYAARQGLSAESITALQHAGVGTNAIGIVDDIVAGSLSPAIPASTSPAVPVPQIPTGTPIGTPQSPTGDPTTPDTSSLDAPDATFPQLTTAHVAVLRAVRTPEQIIAKLASGAPSSQEMDAWIQSELMQAPEAWDEMVGNPAGTARAGLQQLIPGIQLPAPGAGNPQLPGVVTGQPGVTQPGAMPSSATPYENGQNDLMKNVVMAGGVGIAGFLGYRFFKGRAARNAAQAAASAAAAAGGGAAPAVADAASRTLGMAASSVADAGVGAATSGLDLTSMMIMHGRPSQAWQLSNGLMPGLEHSGQALNTAAHWNLPADVALRQARFELAATTGQLLEGAIWEHGAGMAPVLEALGRSHSAASVSHGAAGSLSHLLEGEGGARLVKLLERL